MYFPGFESVAQRDVFFRKVSSIAGIFLPKNLKLFQDATKPGNNWLRLRYPVILTGSSFELQFASINARTHQAIFGPGNHIILAHYFTYNREGILPIWMNAVLHYRQNIEDAFKQEVVISYWGNNNARNYVMIGVSLKQDQYGIYPEPYGITLAEFIQAVFQPIVTVTRSVGL